jgi:hypothetical protein
VLLDHLRRRAALLRNRLDVLICGKRQADKRVPSAVEIPLPDSLRAQRRVPVILTSFILIDRSAIPLFKKVIVLSNAQLFRALEYLHDIR